MAIIWFLTAATTFGVAVTQAILADLNGDGNLDVVLQDLRSGSVYLGEGTGQFTH